MRSPERLGTYRGGRLVPIGDKHGGSPRQKPQVRCGEVRRDPYRSPPSPVAPSRPRARRALQLLAKGGAFKNGRGRRGSEGLEISGFG